MRLVSSSPKTSYPKMTQNIKNEHLKWIKFLFKKKKKIKNEHFKWLIFLKFSNSRMNTLKGMFGTDGD